MVVDGRSFPGYQLLSAQDQKEQPVTVGISRRELIAPRSNVSSGWGRHTLRMRMPLAQIDSGTAALLPGGVHGFLVAFRIPNKRTPSSKVPALWDGQHVDGDIVRVDYPSSQE